MQVHGESVSGLGTRLTVPELGITFDMGSCPLSAVSEASTVLITHGHMDHVGAAARLASLRDLSGMSPPRFVVPDHTVEAFEAMFAAFESLNRCALPRKVLVVAPGGKVDLGRGITAEAFPATHCIPAVSYGVWREVRKLRDEFVGKPGSEIAAAKAGGVEVTRATTTLEFVYTGDTTMGVFDLNPVLYTAKTLAMEVTFFAAHPEEKAREYGHTHIREVLDRADRFRNEKIVLVHNSARYSEEQKGEALASLPESLRNRSSWLP